MNVELQLDAHIKADREGRPTLKIVAHRGYSGKYPELSPLAFEKALELPIHGIECDVRMSRDGMVVVNHDATLDRTSNRSGKISALDWAEIKRADIGSDNHPQQYPLLLDELLEMWEPSSQHLYIETKHPGSPGIFWKSRWYFACVMQGLSMTPGFTSSLLPTGLSAA